MRHASARSAPRSRQDLAERTHLYMGVDARGYVRVGISPGLGLHERLELRDHHRTTEAGRARVLAVYCRARSGQQQAAFVAQRVQARQVFRTCLQSLCQHVLAVIAFNHIPHGISSLALSGAQILANAALAPARLDTGATKAYPRHHCTWLDAAARRFLRPMQPPTTVPLLRTGPPGRAT
ncbi:hypothetical protein SMG44B_10700 [Stenotrophomonas maltophilia]